MARPLRIELAGGLYHVTARGDRREAIYTDNSDRLAWLALLGEVCARYNWSCHAYCMMTNHYHVVIETPEPNLSRGMRQLNGVYTQRFNRRHDRVGHVFQGRYHAVLVEQDAYLLELARYVVLNPVRAGMVRSARNWRWSSYLATLGEATSPDWLRSDWLLAQFGSHRRTAIARYAAFVHSGIGDDTLWDALSGQIFLGGETFVETMKQQLPADLDLREVPRAQHRPKPEPLSHYTGLDDAHGAMAQAYRSGAYTMLQIAQAFGVHYATVSRAVHAAENND